MTVLRVLRQVLAVCAMLLGATCLAQDDENLPTLKLDRIASQPAFSGQTRAAGAEKSSYKVEVIAAELSAPWALAFLPDGRMLVNENTGTMKVLSANGQPSGSVQGLPAFSHEGWAGLFDVAVDPQFSRTGLVYFSYVALSDDTEPENIPRVARGVLDARTLRMSAVEVIVDGFGGQELHFAPDGSLLVSGFSAAPDDDAQDLGVTSGKLLRLNRDGSIPADNPFTADKNARAEIFSYGHRDISGFASQPGSGAIWITEHGPRGGDELNRIRAGGNYGWKVISYGTDYNGDPIGGGGTQQAGMEQPAYFWRPSIAPSGLIFYSGDMFPEWQGNIIVTSLTGQHLARLVLEQNKVVSEERLLLEHIRRIREVRQGPDGSLYVLTNEDSGAPKGTAELLRLSKP